MSFRNSLRHASFGFLVSLMSAPVSAAELPTPLTPEDFIETDPMEVAIGRQLFFDPILSGNRNIACATCHHPTLGSTDAVSLSIGEGGFGLGTKRIVDEDNHPISRIPRNAPALWNLGLKSTKVMFHDGRLSLDENAPFGIKTPKGLEMERPVKSLVAAQAMLPPTSDNEMAGHGNENPIAQAGHEGRIKGPNGIWAQLAARVDAIPEYRRAFDWVIGADRPIHMTDIANAIGAYIAFEFRCTDSPFDRFLDGRASLEPAALRGVELFYGKAGCADCHSGANFTDQSFHAIAVPQIGPGKGPKHLEIADIGRGAVTGNPEDDYRFRTPTLRNITLTAPYGHAGAYADLEDMVRHHLNPTDALGTYRPEMAVLHKTPTPLADDFKILSDPEEMIRIAAATEIEPISLSDGEISDLIAFLGSLTDSQPVGSRLGIPSSVPSGLPIEN